MTSPDPVNTDTEPQNEREETMYLLGFHAALDMMRRTIDSHDVRAVAPSRGATNKET